MMEDSSHLMQTELTAAALISHRPAHYHRFAPYSTHRPHHLTPVPLYFQPPPRIPTRPKTPPFSPPPPEGTHISHLFPEILTMIFERLPVRDKGRAAQVCTVWREAANTKSVWKGVEARLHLRRSLPLVYASLVRRGIRKIQILSMKRSIRDVVSGVSILESLNLSGCYNITDHYLALAFQTEYPNLRVLDLSLCKQITDQGLGKIAQYLKNLDVLELGGCCNITNTGMLLIAWGLRNLRRLNLRSCWSISDNGIGHLAGCSKDTAFGKLDLEYLGLQDLPNLSDDALKHISTGLTTLKSINLSFCVSVTDSGLKHLAKMPHLEELNLGSCDNISDIGMAYLTDGCTSLLSLDVSFCDKIGDPALNHISHGLFQLRSLSLNHCQITDDGLERLSKNLHDLQTLNIGQCDRITDRGIESLATELQQLSAIDLYGCTEITRKGLEVIMKLPKLTKLNLGLWLVR